MEQEKSEICVQLSDSKSTKSSEIVEFKTNIEKLEINLRKLIEESFTIEEEKTRLENDFKEISNKKSEIEKSYQEALAKIEKLEIIEKQKVELEELIIECKARNESWAQQIEDKNSECERLESQLNEHQASSAEEIQSLKEASSVEIQNLTKKIHSLEENLEKLQEGSSNLAEEKTELEFKIEQILKAKSEVDDNYEKSLKIIARLEIVEKNKLTLDDINAELKFANDSLSKELEAKLVAMNEKSLKEIETLTSAKDAVITELSLNVESCEANIKKLKEDSQVLSDQKKELESKYQETLIKKSEIEVSHQKTMETIERLETVEKEKFALDKVNAELKVSNDLLSQKIEQQMYENEVLSAKMNEQQETSSKEIEALNQHIHENEEKLQVLTTLFNHQLIFIEQNFISINFHQFKFKPLLNQTFMILENERKLRTSAC